MPFGDFLKFKFNNAFCILCISMAVLKTSIHSLYFTKSGFSLNRRKYLIIINAMAFQFKFCPSYQGMVYLLLLNQGVNYSQPYRRKYFTFIRVKCHCDGSSVAWMDNMIPIMERNLPNVVWCLIYICNLFLQNWYRKKYKRKYLSSFVM